MKLRMYGRVGCWLILALTMSSITAQDATVAMIPRESAPQVDLSKADGAMLLAVVERDPILLADVRPRAQQALKEVVAGRSVPEADLKRAEEQFIRKLLQEYIQMKVTYRGFLISVAGSQTPDKARDVEQQVRTRARKYFYEQEIPRQISDRKLKDLVDLDAELRKTGMTLEILERQFIEAMAGSMFLREQVPTEPVVSVPEMMEYYEAHLTDYDQPSRARWEQLTVLFEKVPQHDTAFQQIVSMGNEALFGGNFAAVAKKHSHEALASSGGQHDWTRKGSLKSTVLDEAIFSLPLNKLSEILEDDAGYHIVRVLEREEARRKTFAEVQDSIKKTLQDEKRTAMRKKVMEQLQKNVPVWSLFPDDYPGAQPLADIP